MFEKGSNPSDSRTTRIRVRLYMWSVISEDIETQQKGVVGIAELREEVFADLTNSETRSAYKAVLDSLPVRFSAVHLILNFPDSPIYRLIKSAVILGLFGSDERVRTKCYDGISTETTYSLMSFGIPVQEIPLTSGGNIKTKNLLQWIKTRRAIDTFRQGGASVSNIIMHPNTHDVLFSRGGNAQHLGNKEFHQFLDLMNTPYHSSEQRDEMEGIRNEIISFVSSQNGRFLQVNKDGGWWEEISDLESIHFKINNAFYDYNRKLKAMQNQQMSKSATSNFLEPNKRRKIDGVDAYFKGCF
ncbi:hypothetical protein IV203_030692 [Nitzschia inconspicua]|uniref:DUF6824 domain-containing protein n=1 Tax=Nitzschia inconspicua TaxID=303405 RepID=A0A9K3Q4F1_9STRA|nr:hypothetical protein IV203_030692 [Nitzschia inconspicua]